MVSLTQITVVGFALVSQVLGHMQYSKPCPRKSKYSRYYSGKQDVDYNMSSPLGKSDELIFPFPCRGYPPGPAEGSYQAGGSIQVQFTHDGAIHNGGHCQFALSYGGDSNFVVIHTIKNDCFRTGLTIDVPLPKDIPNAERVTFAWTWINATGNREYYMSCSDIAITGGSDSGCVIGKELLVVNLPGYPVTPEFGTGTDSEGCALLDARKDKQYCAGGASPSSNSYRENPKKAYTPPQNHAVAAPAPETPATPAYPETPATPAYPETPATPAYPETPATPAYPETPATPAYPETPATPAYPEIPAPSQVPCPPGTPGYVPPQTAPSTSQPSSSNGSEGYLSPDWATKYSPEEQAKFLQKQAEEFYAKYKQ